MLPIPKVEHDYFLKKDKKSQMLKSMQLLKFTVNGMGVFPKTLFGEEESYPFAPESFFTHDTYEAEVDRLTQLIIDLGYNVYLRDVSFLGFPSYYVYVPFMSPIGKKAMHGDKGIDSAVITANDRIEDLFFPFTDLTDEKVSHLTQLMDKTHDSKMKDALKVEFDQSSDWDFLPTSFFLTLFYYRLGEYKDALKSLKKFRKYENHEKESPAYKYYSAVQQFLELETRGVVGHEKRQHLIDAGHVPETVDSVIDCFSDKDKLFDRVSVPACPSCDECSLVNECLTKGKVGLAKRINLEMKKQPVSQAQFGMATA